MPAIHIVLQALIILLCGLITRRLAKEKARWFFITIALLIGLGGHYCIQKPHLITRILPYRDIIFYTNPYIYAIIIFAAATSRFGLTPKRKKRILTLLAILFLFALYPYHYFYLPPAEINTPTLSDKNGICIQTSQDTCSAAAAVTLLRLYQIETTEAQIARLALTKKERGTRRLGLYRAFKTIAHALRLDLNIQIEQISTQAIITRNIPAIVTAGIRKATPNAPHTPAEQRLTQERGWIPGAFHDIVYLGRVPAPSDQIWIADPVNGRESLSFSDLHLLHTGYVIYLE